MLAEEHGGSGDLRRSARIRKKHTGLATQIRIRVIIYIQFHFVGGDVMVITKT